MYAKDGVDLRVVHHTLLDHIVGTAGLTRGCTFFGRLKDKNDRPLDLVLHSRKDRRRPQQHRHVCIMAAGMHHPDRLAVVFALDRRSKRDVDPLRHRQAVHIGTQPDDRARLRAL